MPRGALLVELSLGGEVAAIGSGGRPIASPQVRRAGPGMRPVTACGRHRRIRRPGVAGRPAGSCRGATRSRHHARFQQVQPVEEAAICSGLRSVISGVPTWFQCAIASSMAAPLTALVEWLTARKLPGTSAATSRLTISCAFRPSQERSVRPGLGHDNRQHLSHPVARFPVNGEVVLTAQTVVPDPGRMRHRRVKSRPRSRRFIGHQTSPPVTWPGLLRQWLPAEKPTSYRA
jgi:hypothetical protein